jgi:hypothetical protein
MTTYDFEAVTSVGVTVATFSELSLARKWARKNAHRYGGLKVECVTRIVRRQTVYRPRGALRVVEAA